VTCGPIDKESYDNSKLRINGTYDESLTNVCHSDKKSDLQKM